MDRIGFAKYMRRKKFYVPWNEISRYYKKEGDLHPSDIFFDCDFEEDDFEEW